MKQIRLLLVDDEGDFLKACERRLVRRNVDVSLAGSGREALEMIAKDDFDVVVLDIMMPEMSGIETLKRLREINADIPVVILTGHANTEALMQVIGGGAFDYMLKPVGADELYFKIVDAVRDARFRVG
ncbi:response regulator [Maridesulfovibrio sp.]|uniref:response regulator n=1 Tax=Maridesulfovibrio sp. TaxID=2795000 RepID=UPI002A187213|nr:response regulator [Maridesulfovibrio sp.]